MRASQIANCNWFLGIALVGLLANVTDQAAAQPARSGQIQTFAPEEAALRDRQLALEKRSHDLQKRAEQAAAELERLVADGATASATLTRLTPPACGYDKKLDWANAYRCVSDQTGGQPANCQGDCNAINPNEQCSAAEFTAAKMEMIKHIPVTRYEVARSCIDAVNPTVDSSYPEASIQQQIRFMNTCGNRWCVSQGFYTGRLIEYFNQKATAECRHLEPPATITPACSAMILEDGKPIERINVSVSQIATECIDSLNPTRDASMPTTDGTIVRFVNTCGNRSCQKRSFASGRVIEHFKDDAVLECYRDGQTTTVAVKPSLTVTLQTTVEAIAKNCIDAANPTLDDNLPASADKTMRFVNTCGNRYCMSQKYRSGRVTEYLGKSARVACN